MWIRRASIRLSDQRSSITLIINALSTTKMSATSVGPCLIHSEMKRPKKSSISTTTTCTWSATSTLVRTQSFSQVLRNDVAELIDKETRSGGDKEIVSKRILLVSLSPSLLVSLGDQTRFHG